MFAHTLIQTKNDGTMGIIKKYLRPFCRKLVKVEIDAKIREMYEYFDTQNTRIQELKGILSRVII